MRKFKLLRDINDIIDMIETLTEFDILLMNDSSHFTHIINPKYFIKHVKKLMKLIDLYSTEKKSKSFYAIVVATEMQKIFANTCIKKMNLQHRMRAFDNIRDVSYAPKNCFIIGIGDAMDHYAYAGGLFFLEFSMVYFFNCYVYDYKKSYFNYNCLAKINNVKSLTFIMSLIITLVKRIESKYS